MDCAGLEHKVTLRSDIVGVVDDHGNNRYADLHRHMEAALLEWSELASRGSGAFGGNDQRFFLILHCRYQRFHGFNRFFSIRAIDKYRASHAHYPANHWSLLDFFFTHTDDIAAHQTGHDGNVRFALMIEHKDRWTMAPEVFLADNLNVQANQSVTGIGKQ